jgi:hypothetical protein
MSTGIPTIPREVGDTEHEHLSQGEGAQRQIDTAQMEDQPSEDVRQYRRHDGAGGDRRHGRPMLLGRQERGRVGAVGHEADGGERQDAALEYHE